MDTKQKQLTVLIVLCGLFLSLLICGGVSASNNTGSNSINSASNSKTTNYHVKTPTLVTKSKITTKNTSLNSSTGIPYYYDLRKLGKLTPIKNQGFSDVCWAFAATGSLESNMLPYKSWNFSENNMKDLLSRGYKYGFDRGYDEGGCWEEALAYLNSYIGPVTGAQDPFNELSGSSPTNLKPVVHVQNTIQLQSRTLNGVMNNTAIKEALMKYGAIYSLMTFQDYYYNPNTYSYYYKGHGDYNHAICIVGWDDNYSKTNFAGNPPGNGAFIIRNSWGADWGDQGYFYVSYYDKNLANTDDNIIFLTGESVKNYNNIYQYDPFGDVGNYGYNNDVGWFSNVFKSNGRELLKAASFYATQPNTSYKIYVYLNPVGNNPRSGILAAVQQGIISSAGYKTIVLNKFVNLMKNQKFSIVVKLVSPEDYQPITIEYPLIDYSSKARASPGQSFISPNGISWEDMTSVIDNANVCLKAFTSNLGADLAISVKASANHPKINSIVYYYVKVTNLGPQESFNVLVNNLFSTKLDFMSYIKSIGSYNQTSNLWSIENLPAGSVAYLILKFTVTESGEITNNFIVSSKTYDYNLSNNAFTSTIFTATDQNGTNRSNNLNASKSIVSNSIPMKDTGFPLLPLVVGILLVTLGYNFKRR
ncbi:MAG: lectin like domain-containing protein [Methanobacterium sp. ERen5]|nr:MAG: lectin like domain-containing protein [Methanobacterium sp. ERen5]